MLRANVEPAGMGWEPGRAAVAAGSYGFYMAVIIWLVVSNITWLIYGFYIYCSYMVGAVQFLVGGFKSSNIFLVSPYIGNNNPQ